MRPRTIEQSNPSKDSMITGVVGETQVLLDRERVTIAVETRHHDVVKITLG